MKAVLDHTEEVARNIKTFWFKPERKIRYIAGQFTELYLPHIDEDNRGSKRWFTLSSSPTEKLVSITTKYANDLSSSFKRALFALKPGSEITLADPMGDFVLPKDTSIPLVFVAGGIGITPVRSMIKFLYDTSEIRKVKLIYAARSWEEVAFRKLFNNQGLNPIYVISNPPAGYSGETAPLTAKQINTLTGDFKHALIYISGPEPMVETLIKDLKKLGVDNRRLISDYFPNYVNI